MKRENRIKITTALFLVLFFMVVISMKWLVNGWNAGWERGSLTISEGTYYSSHIKSIIKRWQRTNRNASFGTDGRFSQSYKTLLVVDVNKEAMWIEDNGKIQEEYYVELPARLKWKLYHITPQDKKALTGRILLKLRGSFSERHAAENFYLVGTQRNSKHICIRFNFKDLDGGCRFERFDMQSLLPRYAHPSAQAQDIYPSMIVTDSEYQEYLDSLNNSTLVWHIKQGPHMKSYPLLKENKTTWLNAEKAIYKEIEKKTRKAGYTLTSMEVKAGPDFSAGHAILNGDLSSLIKRFLSDEPPLNAYLKIDYLGNGVWFIASSAHSWRLTSPRSQFNFESLMCPTSDIPQPQRSELVEKGRTKQQSRPIPASKWKVVLSNGAIAEFVGICENPSAGKQWWDPDGEPLGYAPYINTEAYEQLNDDKTIYEIAWRTKGPDSKLLGSGSKFPEGCKKSYPITFPRDRYGNRVDMHTHAFAYAFDKSRLKTNLTLSVSVDGGTSQIITFKNISLVRGRNSEFSIE